MTYHMCAFCSTFVYDSEIGEPRARIKLGAEPKDLPAGYQCPVCGNPKSYLKVINEITFQQKKRHYNKLYPHKKRPLHLKVKRLLTRFANRDELHVPLPPKL